MLWMPAVLHSAGASPSQAIFSATVFSLSVVATAVLGAPFVDRGGMERVLTGGLAIGGLCALAIGSLDPPFSLLLAMIAGAGIGGGCQGGINALSALTYPTAMRATGAGWALGAGRAGAIIGPLLGGALLTLGLRPQAIFVAAAVSAFAAMALMAVLARGWKG